MNDAIDLIIEDAKDNNLPLVLALDGAEPNANAVENCDAILYMAYKVGADHGASYGDFFAYTLPSVFADMLFGVKEPMGSLVFEIARSNDDALMDWGDLQNDTGASDFARLYLMQLAKNNPSISIPTNMGDPLYTVNFGMRYGMEAGIKCNTLLAPQALGEVEKPWILGMTRKVSTAVNKVMSAGEPFDIRFVAQNDGDDGYFFADVYDGEECIASKFIALDEGQFRVVTIELTLDAGIHDISVCGLNTTITVE